MGEGDRRRHQFRSFIASKAEHEALISRTLVFFGRGVDAHGDIGRLLFDGGEHGAGFPIETHAGAAVADFLDGFANDLGHIDPSGRGDFSGNDDHTCFGEGFAGDAGLGILSEDVIEDGVGDLVADFIGMTFGHGLRCEVSVGHDIPMGAMCCGIEVEPPRLGEDFLRLNPPCRQLKLWN